MIFDMTESLYQLGEKLRSNKRALLLKHAFLGI